LEFTSVHENVRVSEFHHFLLVLPHHVAETCFFSSEALRGDFGGVKVSDPDIVELEPVV
jgi:hypothetical protein